MRGTIGDSAPLPLKESFVDRHKRAGQVLYLLCPFTDPAKDKYLVLVHPRPGPLLFRINSGIRPYVENRSNLKDCQVQIKASEYEFLTHDSYIDCSQVIYSFTEADITEQLLADISRVKGQLAITTREKLIAVVQKAPTISPRYKKRIIASLQRNDSKSC